MLRRTLSAIAIAFATASASALTGCNDTDGLPTVPPPPKEGTVKAASGGPGVLPPEAIEKLRGNNKKLNANVQAN